MSVTVTFSVRGPLGPDSGSNSARIPISSVAQLSGRVSALRWEKHCLR
jgi:hypothetical protein